MFKLLMTRITDNLRNAWNGATEPPQENKPPVAKPPLRQAKTGYDALHKILTVKNIPVDGDYEAHQQYHTNTQVWKNGVLVQDGDLSTEYRIKTCGGWDEYAEFEDSCCNIATLKNGAPDIPAEFRWQDFGFAKPKGV